MILPDIIAPGRTALLLIDMQVDFASSSGAMGKAGFDLTAAQAAVAQAENLAAAARAAGVKLFFIRLITRGDATPQLCREGSPGAEFVGPQPGSGDYVASKSRYSGFVRTRLDESLRASGCDTLVLCGLTTECCIAATAWDAFERDYQLVIAADAIAAYEPDLHQGALKALGLNCARLADTAQIVAAWGSALGK